VPDARARRDDPAPAACGWQSLLDVSRSDQARQLMGPLTTRATHRRRQPWCHGYRGLLIDGHETGQRCERDDGSAEADAELGEFGQVSEVG
jgi:hypothetical protein